MDLRLLLGSCLGLVLVTCIDREPFACDDDEQCEAPGRPGFCVEPGFCAHPDDSCSSGLRFGRFASAQLAEQCTDPLPLVTTGEGTASSESSDSSDSSSSGDPIPVEECDGIDNDGDGLIDEWSPVNEQCNDCDLYQEQGRAYWRCSNGRWTDLQPRCASFGANLASITEGAHNVFLLLRTESGANWIGLNDLGDEGVYTWIDGEPLVYTSWPSDIPPADNPDSNCGAINTQGEWIIVPCNNSRAGFCAAPHPD